MRQRLRCWKVQVQGKGSVVLGRDCLEMKRKGAIRPSIRGSCSITPINPRPAYTLGMETEQTVSALKKCILYGE